MRLTSEFFAILLPWLNPWATGPSPGALPLLFSWVCGACLLLASVCWTAPPIRPRLGRAAAAAWLSAALVSSVLGLLQYFGWAQVLDPWVSASSLGDAYANLRQRNQFATLTNMGLAALLWWRPSAGPGQGTGLPAVPNPWGTGSRLVLLAAVLLGVGNAASSSRTGLLQLLGLAALAWVWRGGPGARAQVGRVLGAALLAYAVAALALPVLAGLDPEAAGILARLHAGDARCSSRLTLWSNVLHLIAQKPWLGWGVGELGFAHFSTLYPGPRFCDILGNAHNLPLHLAVTLGVPAALAVCGTVVWLVWRSKPWRETDATRQMAWAVLVLIGLHSLLEYPLWYGPFQVAVGLCVWLLWPSPKKGLFRPLTRILVVQAAIVLIAFLAYAAWDYWRVSQIYLPPPARAAAYQTDTLQKIRGSWLFQDQVRFAELTTTPLTPGSAAHLFKLAQTVLHFSPEARVAQILVESAVMLGRDADALYYLTRFKAAFPEAHARWASQPAR